MSNYFNDAIIGNSSLLACIKRNGELIRAFWPNIDYLQHIDKFYMGIYLPEKNNSVFWLHSSEWDCSQEYLEDTNILLTSLLNRDIGLKVQCTDFVLNHKDVLIRNIEINNISSHDINTGFILYSKFISNTVDWRNCLFDFSNDCIISYRHNNYISVASSRRVAAFQIGNNPFDSACRNEIYGIDDIGMTGEAVQSWDMDVIKCGEKQSITIYICFAQTLNECMALTESVRIEKYNLLVEKTNIYWKEYLNYRKIYNTSSIELDKLYKRSLLVFKLLSDKQTGGLLAAPELDESFTRCGRYAYCWGRDAAFITSALDDAGYYELADKFFLWAAKTQAVNGAWYQRYYMDGNLAPSWGLQIDETGTILWGYLRHYKVKNNIEFLETVWDSIRKGADFLVSFIEPENNLPKACYDLWEERVGQHTYSAAAVYAGLMAAVEADVILNKNYINKQCWENTAKAIKTAMEVKLWDSFHNKFFRGINTKVEDWGFEGHGGKREITVNSKGFKVWVSALDIMTDVSLLGVAVPFGVFSHTDYRVVNTADAIENRLTSPNIGGIKRYETDRYMGGNPWILTTLWLALYHIGCENYLKAREYLLWTVQHQTYLGLLPEQVDKESGQPVWVVPLTWSHAMFVLVYLELAKRGYI